MIRKLVLASASPRRKEIFEQLGLAFTVCPPCGEEHFAGAEPARTVQELSLQKAWEVAKRIREAAFVVGADTVVAHEGEILGKPGDEEKAYSMLKRLQGSTHEVYTGVAVVDTVKKEMLLNFAERTKVSMYPMTDAWIRSYIASGEPMDKAGAYAVQGGCMPYIREICGEYSNVVGFPAARFYQELLHRGIDLWKQCGKDH